MRDFLGMSDFLGMNPAVRASNRPADNVGGSVFITRGDPTRTVLELAGRDLPSLLTLSLVRRDAPLPGENVADALLDCPLVATINYGAGGVQEVVQVDWLNGLDLTVPTGNLRVAVSFPQLAGATATVRQMCAVMASEKQRPPGLGALPQARLSSRVTLGSGVLTVVGCPARATAFRLYSTDPTYEGSFEVGQLSSAGRATPFAVTREASGSEVPLLGGARALQLTNRAPVALDFTLLWSISL